MSNESIQIHLNSEDSIKQYSGTGYVEFSLPFFTVPSTSTLYCSVVHANIPYSFYNINVLNNTLVYLISNVLTSITIPIGNYTASTLLQQLTLLLPNTFTITYNSKQNTYTFTNTSNQFTFVYSSTIGFSTCFGLLGFTNVSQASTANGTIQTLTSNSLINLAPVRCICIYTTLHTGSISTLAPLNQNILCSIPVSTAPFTMISYKSTDKYRVNLNTNVFNNIIIKLTDQECNTLNLNNINWSLTLQLDVVDYVFDNNI